MISSAKNKKTSYSYYPWYKYLCPLALMFFFSCSHLASDKISSQKSFSNLKEKNNFISWVEFKNQNVVRQRLDYSCGAASLGTILRYYFKDNLSEMNVIKNILKDLSKDEVIERQRRGFSLLDLKRAAISMNYQAMGVKLNFKTLSSLNHPMIVHLDRGIMKHFVVFRGSFGNRVYLADPSWGNVTVRYDKFDKEWTRTALIITKKGYQKHKHHPLMIKDSEKPTIESITARISLYNSKSID